jgi:hypothetical protein
VASDCKEVVTDIAEGTLGKYATVISEIKARSLKFQSCNFIHEGIASNFKAHNLAKHALSLGVGRHVWLLLPCADSIPVNIVLNQ